MLQMTLPTPSKPIDATLLPQLLELYLVECTEVRNVKPHTLENYRNYISPLLKWLDAQPTKLPEGSHARRPPGAAHCRAGRTCQPLTLG